MNGADLCPEPTVDDLEREFWRMVGDIIADCDPRDHGPNGRWPMAHQIARRISEMEAA